MEYFDHKKNILNTSIVNEVFQIFGLRLYQLDFLWVIFIISLFNRIMYLLVIPKAEERQQIIMSNTRKISLRVRTVCTFLNYCYFFGLIITTCL